MKINPLKLERLKFDIYNVLHVGILILSLFLVISISIDTFENIPFQTKSSYLKIQFWICIFFLLEYLFEFFLAKQKLRYFFTHFLFLVISIPYLNIIDYYQIQLSDEAKYFVRYIPLVRGGYALAIIVGRFTKSKATSLLVSYFTMLLATVYFSSLLFFVLEHKVNTAVTKYTDCLWWAAMNVTTVGSNIYAITTGGRILSFVLAALGMMMFPIFTVYITSVIQKVNNKTDQVEGNS